MKDVQADPVSAVAALADPTRRSLYDYVLDADGPVSRDDASEALGLARGTAAFHLDRLAKEGLLDVSYRRLSGRVGPGSGRPTKLYAPAEVEVAFTIPGRQYELAARILAGAVAQSAADGVPINEALRSTAARAGADLEVDGGLEQALDAMGYRPAVEEDGSIVMRNCPFHGLAQSHTAMVCGMNLDLLTAAARVAGVAESRVVLDPAPGRCCVRILPDGD
ncbi:helix-turn-helix domain-containing protein [Tessaracoccus lubricantis]|uniref:Helix-turn-helix domain-containing protein n=1 Tax=Tessaracoccus lubricantis TaxID=545543 RepID=A0ABP9EV44_9ACTN